MKRLMACKEVVGRETKDGTQILMKMDASNSFFKIDGVAAQVWTALKVGISEQELVEQMSEKYPHHKEELKSDIKKLLVDLHQKKLIQYWG